MGKRMKQLVMLVSLALPAAALQAQEQAIEAVTATGEKVRLFGNGRWEFVNEQKAVAQRQAVEADLARERSSQGGFFGIGRRLYEGDKDFNRGSLNPKLR